MPDIPQKQYFRPYELPVIFGVKPKTIYNWLDMGFLEKLRIGGCTIITRESIIKLLKERNKKRSGP